MLYFKGCIIHVDSPQLIILAFKMYAMSCQVVYCSVSSGWYRDSKKNIMYIARTGVVGASMQSLKGN